MSPNIPSTQTLLEQIIDRHPVSVPPDTSLSIAIAAMNQARTSYILIVEHQKLLGIFTERDVVKITANEIPFEQVSISQVMTESLITLCLEEAGTIFDLLALLRSARIRHLPILDAQENLIGVVTSESIRKVLKPTDLLQMRRVAEIMVKKVITTPTNTSVFQVAQQMATYSKSCIVICPESGYAQAIANNKPLKPVGIITEQDIVKFANLGINLAQTPVADVMSSPLLPVPLNSTLWQAHQMMQNYSIRRLVVVDEAGYLAGILTQTNLVHALDPVEMYATVQLLQQTITEKTHELRLINEQMQQEMSQRQQAEAKLQKTKENLAEQVKQRTLELTQANIKLKHEIEDRIAAEIEVRRLNTQLEQRVQERTAQLAASNQELQQTLAHLQATQQELIHSEKMAALGQLIAGVAHEINTPLGAIRSSVENIADFLRDKLPNLPIFFQQLSPEIQDTFLAILQKQSQESSRFSAREKRQFKRALRRQLEEHKIANADTVADTLVDLSIYEEISPFLNLLQNPQSQEILNTAYQLASLQKSTATIRTATERASKVVFALKTYSRYEPTDKKIAANLIEGIETILTLYENHLKHQVEVIRNYQPNLPLIWCYPDQLNQVWTNLIHNALQAMRNKGTLKIDVRQSDDSMIVSISDTGEGISPDIMSKIFEPFFTTKAPGEGSGFGLDIVKKIVDKHQGTIQVDSQPGLTTFKVFLPIELKPE